MPFPGAPPGFVCNADPESMHVEGDCFCSKCLRRSRPGLIEGAPFQVHPKFDVEGRVGLYDATACNGAPVVEDSDTMCCFQDGATDEPCGDVVEWFVWHSNLGVSNPDGVVLQVCSDHLVDVLISEGRNVVWSALQSHSESEPECVAEPDGAEDAD